MKKPVAKTVFYCLIINSKAMNTNTQHPMAIGFSDPGNGGCCGGSITDMGCC